MPKVYLFLKKFIALVVIAFVFGTLFYYGVPYYYTSPVLILIFSLICSRILGESPKELFNFQRSEKYFSKGGLRDLIRIPVVLFAFLHDVVVWFLWGIYQVFLMATDFLYFIKVLIYKLFYGIIWVLLLLVPFWRIVINFIYYYFIKWPWWIYRYAYKALLKTFNWNVLRISFWGSLVALLIIQLFFFLDIVLNIGGLRYIGAILALLPITWIFGEISMLRGQKLLKAQYIQVKLNFRNGLETVRCILFFLTFFVVLLLAQIGFNLLGWIPKTGILFLGISLNINLIINIILVFLLILISFGSIVLPTYRLYSEFSETSLKNIGQLLGFIGRRTPKIISGFIPALFFGAISIIPASLIIVITLSITLHIKNNVTQVKIDKLSKEQLAVVNPVDEKMIAMRIAELNFVLQFPNKLLQEMEHRPFLKAEIEDNTLKAFAKKTELATKKESLNLQITRLEKQIEETKLNALAVNTTRIEELSDSVNHFKTQLISTEKEISADINKLIIESEYGEHKFQQIPIIFYLSGLFFALCLSIVFAFLLGFLGNFFYNSYMYKNDTEPAKWKEFINTEKALSSRQPLLSTTLNIIAVVIVLLIFFYQRIASFIF